MVSLPPYFYGFDFSNQLIAKITLVEDFSKSEISLQDVKFTRRFLIE